MANINIHMIKQGDKIKVHYTGKLEDDTVFDTSLERDPIEFTVGSGQVIEGFESCVVGLNVGDKTSVTINPDKAYGPVREDMIIQVPRKNVPQDVKVGSQLQQMGKDGVPITFIVRDVNEENVTVDANHPLSGKVIKFEIEVIEVA